MGSVSSAPSGYGHFRKQQKHCNKSKASFCLWPDLTLKKKQRSNLYDSTFRNMCMPGATCFSTVLLCLVGNILLTINLALAKHGEKWLSAIKSPASLAVVGLFCSGALCCEFVLHADPTPWKTTPLLWHHVARQNTLVLSDILVCLERAFHAPLFPEKAVPLQLPTAGTLGPVLCYCTESESTAHFNLSEFYQEKEAKQPGSIFNKAIIHWKYLANNNFPLIPNKKVSVSNYFFRGHFTEAVKCITNLRATSQLHHRATGPLENWPCENNLWLQEKDIWGTNCDLAIGQLNSKENSLFYYYIILLLFSFFSLHLFHFPFFFFSFFLFLWQVKYFSQKQILKPIVSF